MFLDLDKDVTKEEKQKLKTEAEEWVKSQIAEGKKVPAKQQEEIKQKTEKREQPKQATATHTATATVTVTNETCEAVEATAAAATTAAAQPVVAATQSEQIAKHVPSGGTNLQESLPANSNDSSAPSLTKPVITTPTVIAAQSTLPATPTEATLPVAEVSSSSCKDIDIEQYSTVSNSTASGLANDSCASSVIQSSQESASVTLSHGDISDPREDYEEEREERTNIKITSEREAFEHSSEHSPGKETEK